MSDDFVALAKSGVKSGASVPLTTWRASKFASAKYIRISRKFGEKSLSATFKVATPREGAEGNQIHLPEGRLELKLGEPEVSVTVTPITAWGYEFSQVRETGTGVLVVLALVIGVIAIVIDTSFDVGKTGWVLFELTSFWFYFAKAFAFLCKIALLVIVWLQATRYKKD